MERSSRDLHGEGVADEQGAKQEVLILYNRKNLGCGRKKKKHMA